MTTVPRATVGSATRSRCCTTSTAAYAGVLSTLAFVAVLLVLTQSPAAPAPLQLDASDGSDGTATVPQSGSSASAGVTDAPRRRNGPDAEAQEVRHEARAEVRDAADAVAVGAPRNATLDSRSVPVGSGSLSAAQPSRSPDATAGERAKANLASSSRDGSGDSSSSHGGSSSSPTTTTTGSGSQSAAANVGMALGTGITDAERDRILRKPLTPTPLAGDGKARPLIIMGAPKCGSTFLWQIMAEAPGLVIGLDWQAVLAAANGGCDAACKEHASELAAVGHKEGFQHFRNRVPKELWSNVSSAGASFRASRGYPMAAPQGSAPLMLLEASPSMYAEWFTPFVVDAFPGDTWQIPFVASMCPPAERMVSNYWHAHAAGAAWGGYGITVQRYNVSVSSMLYAELKDVVMCLHKESGGERLESLDAAWDLPPMTYSSSTDGDPLSRPALWARDEELGFPQLPAIDWTRIPDHWLDDGVCAPTRPSNVLGGMYATLLRRLYFHAVLQPLGVTEIPTWDSDAVMGMLSAERQSRFLLLQSKDVFAEPKRHVDMVLKHAGLPQMYSPHGDRDDASTASTKSNAHTHDAPLDPRVKAQLDAFFERDTALLKRLTGRVDWFD